MCGPSYFSCMGEGKLNILVITNIGMAVLNVILGFILGNLFSGLGIVLAWGFTFSIGSLFLILAYSNNIKINYWQLFTKNDKFLIYINIFIIFISILLFLFNINFVNINIKIIVSCFLIFLSFPIVLKNETLKYILSILKNKKNEI